MMSEILKDTTANTIGTGSGGLKLDPAGTDIVTIGNGVMLPDGVKTAPAIRFTDDNNTGIYSPTNDQVSITGQGEDALLVTGVASSVNVIEVKPSATGSPVEINATGTDANISVNVTPKGTGTLKVAGTDVSLSGHTHTGTYEPADATILKDADIGVTVQAYDATIVVDADIGVSVAAQGHNHDSAYVSVVTTPTTGNFPVLTAGGELDNSSYSAASFATAAHNHTGTYEPANANIQSHVSSTSNPHSVTAAQVGAYTSGAVDTLLTGKSDTSHSHTIDGLSDVTITTPSTGQVIKYNGTAWINDTDAAGTSAAWGAITGTLSAQTDLQSALDGKSTTSHDHAGVYQPVDGDLTAIAALAGTAGILTKTAADTWALDTSTYSTTAHSHTLDGLSDVTITTPASGHVLSYNGSAWVNSAPAGGGVSWATYTGTDSVPVVTPASNVLSFNFGRGGNSLTTTVGTPLGSVYGGSNITTTGNADRNIVMWTGADNGGGTTARTLTLTGSINNVIITPEAGGNASIGSNNVYIGGSSFGSGKNYGVAIGTNTYVGGDYVTCIGRQASVNNYYGTAVGYLASASGSGAVAVGNNTTSSGSSSVAVGSYASAGNTGSVCLGSYTKDEHQCQTVMGAGYFSTQGDTYTSVTTIRKQSTDATPVELGVQYNGSTAPANYISCSNNSAYTYKCLVTAKNTANNGDVAMWECTFAVWRGATAASTTLIGTPTITSVGTGGAGSAWSLTITADTTNGRPAIKGTGAAATTVRWSASVIVNKCA